MIGPWQVLGRSGLILANRVGLDDAYARFWSPRLDLETAVRTPAVLRRDGPLWATCVVYSARRRAVERDLRAATAAAITMPSVASASMVPRPIATAVSVPTTPTAETFTTAVAGAGVLAGAGLPVGGDVTGGAFWGAALGAD